MAIFFDGTDFGESTGNFVYQPLVAPVYEFPEVINTFWGVSGAAIQYSQPHHRLLTMEVTFLGFASEANLRTFIFQAQTKQGDNGTLQANAVSWPNVAFLGFAPSAAPFWDGSGINGWVQQGSFSFRQLYPV